MLQYGNGAGSAPEFSSVVDNYIMLPDEDFDAQARQVREGEPGTSESGLSEPAPMFDENGDPFLPDFPD